MASDSHLVDLIADVVVRGEYFGLAAGDDHQVVAEKLAEDIVANLVHWEVPVDAFTQEPTEAYQFLRQCLSVDLVRLYASGQGPAPALPGLSAEARQVWMSDGGRIIARRWVESVAHLLTRSDSIRAGLFTDLPHIHRAFARDVRRDMALAMAALWQKVQSAPVVRF